MLFRTDKGTLREINKYNYKNDKLYFEKIIENKMQTPKLEKTFYGKKNK